MTDRLRKAIDAGGVAALFGLLKDWSAADLKALVEDCETHYRERHEKIDAAYKAALFTPEVFFSARKATAVTNAKEDAEIEALAVTSEICSVAFYYLDRATPEGTVPHE